MTAPTLAVVVAYERLPCLRCKEPTMIRVEGQPYTYACAVADGVKPAVPDEDEKPLRLLAELENRCAPMHRYPGRGPRRPYWTAPMPGMLEQLVVPAFTWRREHTGPVTVLDRNGGFLSSASSVSVAHGELEQTGGFDNYPGRPGFYEVTWYPWADEFTPHPLGVDKLKPGHKGTLWVPAPRYNLLALLAEQGRWPDTTALDSYTGEGVRLTTWTKHVAKLRADALTRFGPDSEQYERVKIAFSQAVQVMAGTWEPGHGRRFGSICQRPDWTYTIQDLHHVTMWKWSDRCAQLGHPAVGIRNIDELIVPVDALDVITTRKAHGAARPLEIDDTGVKLGTFKYKGVETW